MFARTALLLALTVAPAACALPHSALVVADVSTADRADDVADGAAPEIARIDARDSALEGGPEAAAPDVVDGGEAAVVSEAGDGPDAAELPDIAPPLDIVSVDVAPVPDVPSATEPPGAEPMSDAAIAADATVMDAVPPDAPACGATGQPCCAAGSCNAGSFCGFDARCHDVCGHAGEACCFGTPSCVADFLTCTGTVFRTCQPCGMSGGGACCPSAPRCMGGSTCNGGGHCP